MPETALFFLLLYIAGLALALFVRPMYGLYTYIAVFYVHPPSRWWGTALPDLRWSLIAAGVTFLALYFYKAGDMERSSWNRSTIAVSLILYTVWMWLQMIWVASPSHLEGTILFTKYVVLFYLMYSVIDDREKLEGFCWAHVIGCAYLGLRVYLAPDAGRLEGVGGPGIDDANSLGMHLSTGLVFAGFILIGTNGWKRVCLILLIPFILNGVIQTETRGALVGLLVGAIATTYLKPKRIRGLYYTLAILGAMGFIVMANQAFVDRVSTMSATINDDAEWDRSARSRVVIAKAQFEMFKNHPFGVGHQGTAYLSRSYLDEVWLSDRGSGQRASHNTVMSVLVDQGLPGIIIFGIIGVSAFRSMRYLKAMDANGLPVDLALLRTAIGGALAVAFGAGMFTQFLKSEVQIWCLALLVILCGLARKCAESSVDSHGEFIDRASDAPT